MNEFEKAELNFRKLNIESHSSNDMHGTHACIICVYNKHRIKKILNKPHANNGSKNG